MTQLPVTFPVAGATIGADGVTMNVDGMLQTPTFITEQIAAMIPQNRGFFANRLLRMPGLIVKGGSVGFREVNSSNVLFLDDDGNFAPRAPGAESPKLNLSRRKWKFARVESMSISWEVADEYRKWNQTAEVSDLMGAVANSYADRFNSRAVQLVNAYLDRMVTDGTSRDIAATNWAQSHTSGVVNADPLTLPGVDFRKARTKLINDKTGVADQDLILIGTPEDIAFLDIIYGDKLEAILKRYHIVETIETPLAQSGKPILAVDGGLGYIGFEKELETEQGRGPVGTWKDEFATEAKPVFVVNKAVNAVRLALNTA